MNADGKIVIHHVGARFGNFSVPVPPDFESDLCVVLYDADADCVEELNATGPSPGSDRRILPLCLSHEDGEARLNVAINASASSLLEPSDATLGFTQPLFGIDWNIVDCVETVERRNISTHRLDTILHELALPGPDILSMDTQGSELAILRGAEAALAHTVAVVVEVEFVELYKGVPRFGEIAAHLETRGFVFAQLIDMIDAQTSRQPLGRWARGIPVAADALFIRRVDAFDDLDEATRADRLDRLAFASVVFGHLGHAFAALDQGRDGARSGSASGWRGFLRKLETAAAAIPSLHLPCFPSILPTRAIERFRREPDPGGWPRLFDLTAWHRDLVTRGVDLQAVLPILVDRADTPLETLLRANGFHGVADATNIARCDQSWKLKRMLDQGTPDAP